MSRLPATTARKTLAALQRAGFVVYRITGSHHHLVPAGKTFPVVTVPYHGGDLKRATLRSIIRQAGMTEDEFIEYL